MQQTLNIPMTLEEIRECKPPLWAQLLEKWGVKNQLLKETIPSQELCKMSTYAKVEGDKGNTTLKVKKETHLHLAILDTVAGVSIITKETWELWGKRALTSTRMGLQLVDGEVKYPIGLLEDTSISICDIEITHTFAIVDFGPKTNYEIILGRPFMRQMLVVQDWGYNSLYLRHKNAIVRVNLDDHTYRDVTKSPIEDVDTTSYELSRELASEESQEEGAWLCEV